MKNKKVLILSGVSSAVVFGTILIGRSVYKNLKQWRKRKEPFKPYADDATEWNDRFIRKANENGLNEAEHGAAVSHNAGEANPLSEGGYESAQLSEYIVRSLTENKSVVFTLMGHAVFIEHEPGKNPICKIYDELHGSTEPIMIADNVSTIELAVSAINVIRDRCRKIYGFDNLFKVGDAAYQEFLATKQSITQFKADKCDEDDSDDEDVERIPADFVTS